MRAIYEFPVPIWTTCESLGRSYETGLGSLQFDVLMPADEPPLGGPPVVPATGQAITTPDAQTVWTQEYGAFIPESLRPATAVHRVGVAAVVGQIYADRPWLTPDHQLAESVDRWFDSVRTWIEILTGQDLDPRHRVYDAEAVGTGLTFVEPSHQGALGLAITTPHIRPLRQVEWTAILNFVREGTEPPLEEILSRDARAAQRRGANRRAVLDAATAVEIALGQHIRDRGTELPQSQQKRINDRTALGDYISIAEDSHIDLAVAIDQLRAVNKLRNNAAHRGEAPDNWATATAVQVMIDFLGAHGRYRRTGTSERDGGEFAVANRK